MDWQFEYWHWPPSDYVIVTYWPSDTRYYPACRESYRTYVPINRDGTTDLETAMRALVNDSV